MALNRIGGTLERRHSSILLLPCTIGSHDIAFGLAGSVTGNVKSRRDAVMTSFFYNTTSYIVFQHARETLQPLD